MRKDFVEKYPIKNDLFNKIPELILKFNEPEIPFSEIEDINDKTTKNNTVASKLWDKVKQGQNFSIAHPKRFFFNNMKVDKLKPLKTIIASPGEGEWHYDIKRLLNKTELILGSSFPLDYNFMKNPYKYIIGMSVPPVMIANIATEIYNQWFLKM